MKQACAGAHLMRRKRPRPDALRDLHVGAGFTSQRSLDQHMAMVLEFIQSKHLNGELKQTSIALCLSQRFDLDAEIARGSEKAEHAIIRGLRNFYSTIHSKYPTKMPNAVATSVHEVSQAIMSTGGEGSSVRAISEVVGADRGLLSGAVQRWRRFIISDGDFELVLCGKIRSDAMPNEVAEFVSGAWLHKSITRASGEKKGCGMHNPKDRSDENRYTQRFLETSISEAVQKI